MPGYHDPVYTENPSGDVPIVTPVGYHDPVYTPTDPAPGAPAPAGLSNGERIGIAAIVIGIILGLS